MHDAWTIGVFPSDKQEFSMKEERTARLCQRMIEDMHIPGLAEATQGGRIRNVKLFAIISTSPQAV